MSSNKHYDGINVVDISELVKVKERELHEVYDMRCTQLEQVLN
jgi:hypothetical protein